MPPQAPSAPPREAGSARRRLVRHVLAAWALLWGALATWALLASGGSPLAHADAPVGRGAPMPARPPRHGVRLSAGEEGPFFSLRDLATYAPVTRAPAPPWTPLPPVPSAYPPELEAVPFVPRTYSTETIHYLATHEVRHGDRSQPAIALTFDCEVGGRNTMQILETLRAHDARATFFVLGRYAYMFPAVVRQIAADGHEIGNHSFFHPLFTAISPVTATAEIAYTEAAIDWAIGRHVAMRFFRFPYGGRNDATRAHVASLGYQSAFWNIDPRGWDPEHDADDVIAHLREHAHPGGIVIMHCGSVTDAEALPGVLAVLAERGLAARTLSEVLDEPDRAVPGYAWSEP
ncbi:MAG: polysaccharide deacetylase family protein [Anaerolineae bacterium]|nr:polysaccharide deacetylase family protein [Anaerolineae bacterium]